MHFSFKEKKKYWYGSLVIALIILLLIAVPRLYTSNTTTSAPSWVPAALIRTTDGMTCSGLLVGEKAVLTAAHCAPNISGRAPATYSIRLGSEAYRVRNYYSHPEYRYQLNVTAENSRNDLAVLELDRIVNNYQPVPVIAGEPLTSGLKFNLAAFGNSKHEVDIRNTQYAQFVIESAESGVAYSRYADSESALCSGDSGAVGFVSSEFRNFAVSVASASVNQSDSFDRCSLGPDGRSMFVDLNSTSSQDFLKSVPGVNIIEQSLLDTEISLFTAFDRLSLVLVSKNRKVVAQIMSETLAILNLSGSEVIGAVNSSCKRLLKPKKKESLQKQKKKVFRCQEHIRLALENLKTTSNAPK